MIRAHQKHQKMAYSNSISIASNSAKQSLSSKKKVSSISFHPIQNFFIRLAENEKRVPSACCRRNDNNGLQKNILQFKNGMHLATGIMIAQVYLPLLRNSNYLKGKRRYDMKSKNGK